MNSPPAYCLVAASGANAAWLRLAVITHNVLTALKRLALPAEYLSARPKRLRFVFLNLAGRVVHHARTLHLRLSALLERDCRNDGSVRRVVCSGVADPVPTNSKKSH